MIIGFGAIAAILWVLPWIRGGGTVSLSWHGTGAQIAAVALLALGLALWMISLAAPGLAKPIYVGWMSVAVPIGIVMSTVMLTLLFAILLPIFAVVVRLGDPLRTKWRVPGSYWEEYKGYEATLERMKRPF